jgi:hypothetical protein
MKSAAAAAVREHCGESATCSLHRLNVSVHLFYPSTAEAEADQAAKPAGAAAMSTRSRDYGGWTSFSRW